MTRVEYSNTEYTGYNIGCDINEAEAKVGASVESIGHSVSEWHRSEHKNRRKGTTRMAVAVARNLLGDYYQIILSE